MTKPFSPSAADKAASARIRELVAQSGAGGAGAGARQPNGGTFHIEDIKDQASCR